MRGVGIKVSGSRVGGGLGWGSAVWGVGMYNRSHWHIHILWLALYLSLMAPSKMSRPKAL